MRRARMIQSANDRQNVENQDTKTLGPTDRRDPRNACVLSIAATPTVRAITAAAAKAISRFRDKRACTAILNHLPVRRRAMLAETTVVRTPRGMAPALASHVRLP